MRLIYQAFGSHCCGQCCVATIAGVTLEEAKQACGRNGSTSTKRLRDGLKSLGIVAKSGNLKPIYGDLAKLPHTAILKVVAPHRRSGWHWVLKVNKKIYDPARGVYQVKEYAQETGGKITSYLELFMDQVTLGTSWDDKDADPIGDIKRAKKIYDPARGVYQVKEYAQEPTVETFGVKCPRCHCYTRAVVGDTGAVRCYNCNTLIKRPKRGRK